MEKLITLASQSDVEDIREYKKELRAQCKKIRSDMGAETKAAKDTRIFERIISSRAYNYASTILTYVSTDIEVDTKKLIIQAISDGKRVAVPKCIDGTREMEFYFIESLDDLESGAFGVLEPIVNQCEPAHSFETALCVIPGLAFDMQGYRLGYGKGYYDRFLSAHPKMKRMGICYCSCTCNRLVHGRFDMYSDILITEKYTLKINHEDN